MHRSIIFLLLIGFWSCGGDDPEYETGQNPSFISNPNPCQADDLVGVTPSGDFTTLIWADEFNDNGAPCEGNWNLETIPPNNGSWWNNEQQFYTSRRANSIVENGVLKIIAKKENFEGKQYTSARLTTQNKFDFRYGRVEVRAKLPVGQGTWPAIWLLGSNIDQVSWPACGELDIMEHGSGDPGYVSSALHYPGNNGGSAPSGSQTIQNEATQFHRYQMEWNQERVVFLVDNVEHYSHNLSADDPFHQEFFILLNVAMGGTYVGNAIDPDFVSSAMEVDYVRVYQ